MKIKRFKNLWAMGLILFGVILVLFYIAKIFFPQFIVGVAEIPSIVKFGNYVDTNKWAYYLFNSFTSFITMYFYTCACCRIKNLNTKEVLITIISIIIYYIICKYFQELSFVYSNVVSYIVLPFIVVATRKIKDMHIFYSTSICFIITSFAQVLSLYIRDISTFLSYPNTATYFILLIDLYIWNILLYFYYNYKGVKCNG